MATTTIAIQGIPQKWNISDTVRKIARALLSNFECLGFGNTSTKGKNLKASFKVVYVRLPYTLDPYETIEKLNRNGLPHGTNSINVKAYIPTEIPKNIVQAKPKQVPPKIRRMLLIRDELPPQQAIFTTYQEILTEMQSKFTGLHNLSNKTGHKLLDNLGDIIYARLCNIMETSPSGNCFILSKNYRRIHPHFGDFEMILNTYRQLVPGGDINEAEFTTVSTHPYEIDNVPYDKIQSICNKYADRIVNKVNTHLKSLDSDFKIESDTEEEIARKKVRVELKKLSPYMNAIVKQVVTQNFIPRKSPFHRVRVYGEPFMPTKDAVAPFLKRHHAVKTIRSDRMFNLLKFNIPPEQYGSLMAMDGTLISGAKMVVRSSDIPLYIPAISQDSGQFGHQEMMPYPEDEAIDEEDEGDMEGGEEMWDQHEEYL